MAEQSFDERLESLETRQMFLRIIQFACGLAFVIAGGITLRDSWGFIHGALNGYNTDFSFVNVTRMVSLWPVLLGSGIGFGLFRWWKEEVEDEIDAMKAASYH